MPDKEQNKQSSQNDFMIEKIKTRPVNRRKLIRRTIITVVMAVIFGTVACVTFLILEPVISNRLYPEEEPQVQPVTFPEDQEEMSPEDMLAENIPSESPSPASPSTSPSPVLPPEETESTLTEEQVREILAGMKLGVEDYAQLYNILLELVYEDELNEDGSSYRAALSQHIVTIRGVTSNIDWFDDIQESSNQASGVIVADNGLELLILVDYSSLESAESLVLDLGDGAYRIDVGLKGVDKDTNLAIVAVEQSRLPAEYLETGGLAVATLGSSIGSRLVGTPVIALGSPLGVSGSIGFGMITSADTQLTGPDRNYRLLLTDISGSRNAEGVLFNLNGQVIGIITDNRLDNGMENMINAYGITELRRIIEKLSNNNAFAYMGITGTDVPQYVHNELGVPYGAYVTRVERDSPAMLAGIQVGDVITAMNGGSIMSYSSYCSQLMRLEPGQTVQLTVRRQSQGEYREMDFSIEAGEL
ncbi:MAG: serine protease [Acetatifactor sp.]|nr:serine protease [Acetatifactor sp.]